MEFQGFRLRKTLSQEQQGKSSSPRVHDFGVKLRVSVSSTHHPLLLYSTDLLLSTVDSSIELSLTLSNTHLCLTHTHTSLSLPSLLFLVFTLQLSVYKMEEGWEESHWNVGGGQYVHNSSCVHHSPLSTITTPSQFHSTWNTDLNSKRLYSMSLDWNWDG